MNGFIQEKSLIVALIVLRNFLIRVIRRLMNVSTFLLPSRGVERASLWRCEWRYHKSPGCDCRLLLWQRVFVVPEILCGAISLAFSVVRRGCGAESWASRDAAVCEMQTDDFGQGPLLRWMRR